MLPTEAQYRSTIYYDDVLMLRDADFNAISENRCGICRSFAQEVRSPLEKS